MRFVNAKDAKSVSTAEASRVFEDAEATKVAKIIDESSHLTKEVEKRIVEASAHQNHCKPSNVETSIIFDFIIVDTSSIIVPNTTIVNP